MKAALGIFLFLAAGSSHAGDDKYPIHKMKVLNANYSGMDRYFPKGQRLKTPAPVVMCVGPNGAGKTGFLRLVATSCMNKKYFDKHRISRTWKLMEDLHGDIDAVKKATPRTDGWYDVVGGEQLVNKLSRISMQALGLDLDPQRDVHESGAISAKAVKAIGSLERLLRDPRDENRYQYIKLDSGGEPIYIEELATPRPTDHPSVGVGDSWKNGSRPFTEFDPNYCGKTSWLAQNGKVRSPGEEGMAGIERIFKRIDAFMNEHQYTPFKEKPTAGTIDAMFSVMSGKPKPITVESNARLVVFLDEPTSFLDMANRRRFRKLLTNATQRYGSRLQVFMSTNDEKLIDEAPPGSVVINLFEQPATLCTPSKLAVPDS